MTDQKEIADLIPELVLGKLQAEQQDAVLSAARKSPELAAELSFWRGVYSIRREMSELDFSTHPTPEQLDRFARQCIPVHSAEFSELSVHLQDCKTCREEVELLRQVISLVPDDALVPVSETRPGLLRTLLNYLTTPRLAAASLVPLAVVLLVSFLAFSPWGEQRNIMSILLQPQFESRNVADGQSPREYEFRLRPGTERVAFEFITDRIDIPDYRYLISLTPAEAAAIDLENQIVRCDQSELTNHCVVVVSDPSIMELLHQGGSFSISIREEFPEDFGLEPAEYQYYFRVLTGN